MKKLFFAACLLLISFVVSAQDIQEFSRQTKPVQTRDDAIMLLHADKVIKDTVIKAINYKLYSGSKGGRYIIVVSKKTGKPYKRYFSNKK